MADDGFAVFSPAYRIAAAVFAGGYNGPIVVGRRETAYSHSLVMTPTNTTEGYVYNVSVVDPATGISEDFTYTVGSGDTLADIAGALATLMNASSIAMTPSILGNDINLDTDNAGDFLCVTFDPAMTVKDDTLDPGIAADFANMLADNDQWFMLLTDAFSAAQISALAPVVEPLEKMYFAQSVDSDVRDPGSTTDIAYALNAAGYKKTALGSHQIACQHAVAAWAGALLRFDPGSATWVYKDLAGVTREHLSANDIAAMDTKKANWFGDCSGIGITDGGTVASGEWIDNMRGDLWFLDASRIDLANALRGQTKKLPYTNAGAAVLRNTVYGTAQRGINTGYLNADQLVSVTGPLVEDVPAATRKSRCYGPIRASVIRAGAIHKVEFNVFLGD